MSFFLGNEGSVYRELIVSQLLVAVKTILGVSCGLGVQLVGLLGEGQLQRGIPVLTQQELLEVTGGLLGIQVKGFLPSSFRAGL